MTSGQAAPVVTEYETLKKLVTEKIPEADIVVDRMRGWGKIVSQTSSMQLGINGIDIDEEPGLFKVLTVIQGDLRGLRKPNTALLFEKQAKKLAVSVGDTLTISAQTIRGVNNAIDVEVAAIAKDIGLLSNFSIFSTKQTVRDIYLFDNHSTGAIQIYLKRPERSEEIAANLRTLVTQSGLRVMEPQADPFWMKFSVVTREDWTGQKIDITTWKDELSMMTWVIKAFDTITVVLVSILLIIIVVGVMNTLWMAIRERTREVGTLRAIGMGKAHVMAMFVLEAGLLSLSATAVGTLFGIGLSFLMNALHIPVGEGFNLFLMTETLRLVVAPGSVVRALVTITFVTTIFALYPSYRAARLRPITAIHQG